MRNTDIRAATATFKANASERNEQVRDLIAEIEADPGYAMSTRELASELFTIAKAINVG